MTLWEIVSVLLMAGSPLGELRLSIPVALGPLDMNITQAFFLSLLGNSIPPLILIRFLDPVSRCLMRHSALANRFFVWLFSHTRRDHEHRFKRWDDSSERRRMLGTALALTTIVAVPLPFTGAYSGAVAAFVFDIPPRISIPAILIGIVIAGIIVTAVSLGAFPILHFILP